LIDANWAPSSEDSSQRKVLNGITHPRIILIMLKRILQHLLVQSRCVRRRTVTLKGQLRRLFIRYHHHGGLVIPKPAIGAIAQAQSRPDGTTVPGSYSKSAFDRSGAAMADVAIGIRGFECSSEVERVRERCHGAHLRVGMSLLQMLLLVGDRCHWRQFETVSTWTWNILYT
jgi:hypothetical protein